MDRPPRPGSRPLPPVEPIPEIAEPAPEVSVSQGDTTVVDLGPRPDPTADGRPPRTPRWVLALMAAVIAISLYWWFAQTQRADEVALNATVTAVNQATATAEAANAAAAAAQATATASQAQTQAVAQAQATASAEQAAVANATSTALSAAQVAAADQARATAQAVSVDATVAARGTEAASAPPPPPAPTQTPVVLVVTATPAPPATTVAEAPAPTESAPSAASAPPRTAASAPPANAASAPPVAVPPALPSPAAGGQAQPAGSPAPAPGASPAPVVPVARGNPNNVTVTANQPTVLRCLDNRVQVEAAQGSLPPQTILTCRQIEPGSVPAPAGPVVADTVFELTSSPGSSTTLAGALDLTVTYSGDTVPADERDHLTLGYLNGSRWQPLPEQAADPDQTRIKATVNRPGVYTLYRQP